MAKDYLGSDQRKVRPDEKKDEKEIKVQFSKNISISVFNGKLNVLHSEFLRCHLLFDVSYGLRFLHKVLN